MRTRSGNMVVSATSVVLLLGFGPGVTGAAAASAGSVAPTAATRAAIYLIQGVDATTMTLSLDGKVLRAGAAAKTVVGPITVSAGRHTVSAQPSSGGAAVEATVTVGAGASADVVLHRQADSTLPPEFTTYVNDLSPVTAGSARLTVAHTAAVGPADIRVKGDVLFANVANGEQLSLTVPAGTYPVDIVPTASAGPVVFGPVDLAVAKATLTRVFAIGVAETNSMDAVVQVLPIATRGSGSEVSRVDAGDGGQAQALIAAHRSDGSETSPAGLSAALAAVAALSIMALLLAARLALPSRAAVVVTRAGDTARRGTRHT